MRRVFVLLALLLSSAFAGEAEAQAPLGWDVPCDFTRSATLDPIVFPDQPGAGHLHDFFNNKPTAYATEREDFLAMSANCAFVGGGATADFSGYWTAALYDSAGQKVTPLKAKAYYRVAEGVDPMDVRAFVPGAEVVAGSALARAPQVAPDGRPIATWRCGGVGNGATKKGSLLPPSCPDPDYPYVIGQVRFPDCSDGRREAEDNRSHMAYSVLGVCPPTHPRRVPALFLDVTYGLRNGEGATLSSNPDNAHGYHADFFESWEEGRLAELIVACVRSGTGCGPDGLP